MITSAHTLSLMHVLNGTQNIIIVSFDCFSRMPCCTIGNTAVCEFTLSQMLVKGKIPVRKGSFRNPMLVRVCLQAGHKGIFLSN